MKTNTLAELVNDLGNALTSLLDIFSDEKRFFAHLYKFGYSATSFPPQYQDIYISVDSLYNQLQSFDIENASAADAYTLLSDVKLLYDAVKNISEVPSGIIDTNYLQEVPRMFFTNLLFDYLIKSKPGLLKFLFALNIIEDKYVPAVGNRVAHHEISIETERIKDYITDPGTAFRNILQWGADLFGDEIFHHLKQALNGLGIPAQVVYPTYGYDSMTGLSINGANTFIRIPLFYYYQGTVPIELGIELHYLRGAANMYPGLALVPYFPLSLNDTIQIGNKLFFNWRVSSNLSELFGILFRPNEPVQLRYPFQESSDPLLVDLGFSFKFKSDSPVVLLGKQGTSRLQFQALSLGFDVAIYDGQPEFKLQFILEQLEVVIQPGEGDSFLGKIMSGEKKIPIDLSIMWSSVTGLHFTGSGGFEISLNPHIKLGPVSVEDMKLRLFVTTQTPGGLKIEGAASILADIGPITLTIRDVGIGLNIGFQEGNAGPFDIKLGFKAPTGVGISINAGPVKGGGFLNYNEATSTYTGGLELSFSKISFSAIGIVSTKLPGNQPGYSLLIIITAEFSAIQLGMGFTLNGIGGLLGLNRTMNPDVLRSGIRDKTLDSILFPKDIVKNANTIISNIGQAFPAKEGQFMIGPMAKIGWGTPTLLTIDLGIIIELPEPVRLAILGIVRAILPTEDKVVLKLQVNFLGIIDFTNKYLSFDASIYDSKILTFALFGDMALRLYWGDKPNFLLSVGGFHPRFTPPPLNLPELRRLTIVLADQNNLKISVETYFAITSNSVQFGARVSVMARAWKIQAIGALWFDILFQFSPFYFIADMGVMFAIKMGNKTILSLFVNLSLEGPNPWRAQGKGSFKILFVKVSVSFDKTFGQARVEAIQAEAIDGKFSEALNSKDNWVATLPERSHQLISWREDDPTTSAGELVLDPAGALQFSQKLLPLGIELAKFGTAPISDYKAYKIDSVSGDSGNDMPVANVQDNFARNEFFYMTDDEKLSKDSYERFNSGVLIGADDITSKYAVHKKIDYDDIVIDAGYIRRNPRWLLSAGLLSVHRLDSYVSKSVLSRFAAIPTTAGPDRVSFSLAQEEFVLINRNDMSQVIGDSFSNSEAADTVLQQYRASQPATAANWIVANKFEI